MNCPNCNASMAEHERFCTNCGTPLSAPAAQPAAPAPPTVVLTPQERRTLTKEELPGQFRVLSPWAYFGLQILYSVPVVGFIFLMIHTFSAGNLNRRSFARSYWCALLIVGCILLTLVIIGAAMGVSFLTMLQSMRFRY